MAVKEHFTVMRTKGLLEIHFDAGFGRAEPFVGTGPLLIADKSQAVVMRHYPTSASDCEDHRQLRQES